MQFDPEKLNQELEQRAAEVVVNELKELYDSPPKEDLIFKVRGLSGNDMTLVSNARDTGKFVEMLSDALGAGNGKEGSRAIRGLLGLFDDDLHPQLKYRVEIVVRGSVEPKIDHALAAKLARDFYVVLFRISDKILELTGQGARLKKNSASASLTTSPT